ncbi:MULTISPECIES: efflux RND transporter permease subunit [Caballeronia]|uniref:efflux RND transporter permease subunit n=1 Tax=Caballeronia TaxID=1827195 RepID=UPI0002387A76|nr:MULTISPECIES: efflux RND transporter permease subunit [unclassified Caballeronia]AET88682.1 multidrug efflux system protein [Burkholderia sp. YI23]AQG98142.1 nodulation protein [Burkholderia sp. KK1]BAO85896.1 multidrug efflux system protein [Burkholderia sp. RPE67]BBP95728.1 transport system membrane protein [Burkholderia sp. SFA1]MCE4542370.1 efflux RND transporter permease subunit [Caballeronia sp. PC1]
MNLSRIFIGRPVATTLLAIGIALAGMFAFVKLPVAPLPQVDFPTISVQASLPGASPETVATSVASPLERHLGTIADVSEMTSMSSVGSTRITLQFGLNRDIDGAARDVQAAINAARADLPASLRQNPTYHKVNPADAPILVLALSSPTRTAGSLYDSAATVLQQTLSTVPGVGEVDVSGSANPAVRVELEPGALFHYGIGLEDVRAALASANANSPKGAIEFKGTRVQLYTNDQASKAAQYKDLVVAYRNGSAVKLSDVGEVVDSVEDLRNLGLINNKRAVLVILYRQPGANIIETIDRVKSMLPQLQAALPADVQITPTADRSVTIRSSLHDTELTLMIAVALVVMVVFLFLRNWRATLIPSVAVPISIIGTFAAMYLLGFSLDNLSLMALTIATGFVVDDAIVVLENITRHVEKGVPRMQAAILGAREVGFTVLSISVSLVAVFLPILLMGGIVGRLFREFALTLSLAIGVSLVVSLTVTPMMCSRLLQEPGERKEEGRIARWLERQFTRMQNGYERTLGWALAHPRTILMILLATIGLNIYLYVIVPKGFFPQQDTGRIVGGIQADQSTSFQAMKIKFAEMMKIVEADPAVDSVAGFTGGRSTNSGFMFISLKPKSERKVSADQVINRLRKPLADVAGARTFLQAVQDIRVGGRQSNAQYQFTLLSDTTSDLYKWGPLLTDALQKRPELTDVNSDQQQGGLEAMVTFDRATAARLGIKPAQIDNTLYDAFGQRQVSTIYNPLSQYHVVMELAPKYWQDPEMLKQIWISTSGGTASGSASTQSTTTSASASTTATGSTGAGGASTSTTDTTAALALAAVKNSATNAIAATGKNGSSSGSAVSTTKETMVPLSAIAKFGPGNTPLSVNHQSQFVASTISFNLPPGKSLSDATAAIYETMAEIGMPQTIHGSFQGTAQAFQQSLNDQPLLILAALAAVYIVLGILYESYIHPITILSTLPSAGIGALLALLLFKTEFSIIALIAVILLIGIVKKNAIMMVDFAIEATRHGASTPQDAIREACLLRFRPIMMTTAAALLGALPLAFGTGEGSEMRAPLGIAIVGGLIVSQMLTLYTTPVVYLYMDRFRIRAEQRRARRQGGAQPANASE